MSYILFSLNIQQKKYNAYHPYYNLTVEEQNRHKVDHTTRILGNPNLSAGEVEEIEDNFRQKPESCGRPDMNQIIGQKCRCMTIQVHLSMLVLSRTMLTVRGNDKALRMSNIHVNHNNHSKTAALEIMNNMAYNPLKISETNKNDDKNFGSDVEVYWTLWNKVRSTILVLLSLTNVYALTKSFSYMYCD